MDYMDTNDTGEDRLPGYGIRNWMQWNYWVLARPTDDMEYIPADDYHGESGSNHYIVGHNGIPEEDRRAFLDDVWYETYCQHSYDCCGRIYRSRARILFSSDEVIVFSQGWHMNI